MSSIEPSPEKLRSFLESGSDDAPIVMINLLHFREQAAYPEGFAAEPCSGREAYRRYGEVAIKTIAAVGGRMVWMGSVQATVIGPALPLVAGEFDSASGVAVGVFEKGFRPFGVDVRQGHHHA